VKAGVSPPPVLCALFHEASELIGRRWTGAVIFCLLKRRLRFAELRAAITGITDRMLSERLQELEQAEIVLRTVVPETPVRVEYALTEKGRALAGPIDAIAAWAHDWLPAKPLSRRPSAVRRARQSRS
jgi:DNA-binding HxlR family transcriptional regulator